MCTPNFIRLGQLEGGKKSGGLKTRNNPGMMMMRIRVLDAKRHISTSHKNQSIWNIDTRFTASCLLRQDLSVAIGSKVVACG